MNDVRTLFLAVLIDEIHVISFSKHCVELNGDHRVFLAVYVFGLDVELRTIESSLSDSFLVFEAYLIKDLSHESLVVFPFLSCSEVFVGILRIPFRESVRYVSFKSERGETVLCEFNAALELILDLLRCADKMSL